MHWDTLKWIITAQCEGMGEVGSARHEPALLPRFPSIRVLCYSNCQRSTHSHQQFKGWYFQQYLAPRETRGIETPKYFVQNKQQLVLNGKAANALTNKIEQHPKWTTHIVSCSLYVFLFVVILPLACSGDQDYLDQHCRGPRLPWTEIPGTEITGSRCTEICAASCFCPQPSDDKFSSLI